MPLTMQDALTTDPLRQRPIHVHCLGTGGIGTLTSLTGSQPVGAAVVAGLSGHGGTIVSVKANSSVAPTGTAVILDVNKNGTTIFTSTKCLVATNTTIGTESLEAAFTAAGKKVFNGDHITVDCDATGSATVANRAAKVALAIVVRCDEPND